MDVTTVADDLVVIHDGTTVRRYDGLCADTEYDFDGVEVRTLPRPAGELLCRIGTVNDVHFGEVECGRIDDHPMGPIQRPLPGEPPYPQTMNRAAVAEMAAADLAAVIAKGDLSTDGTDEEWAEFEGCYRTVFGDRLFAVAGNHDTYRMQTAYLGDQWIAVPGANIALLDTTIPGKSTGGLSADQIDWLDAHARDADAPTLVMGHHQQWVSGQRSVDYFGINPDDSDALTAVVARRRSIVAYTAGHTHRHRVRTLASAQGVPTIEVGCVKDFPGTWAEYRIYEGGVMQVVHRISAPDALAWSERCRTLLSDFGIDYATYAMGTLPDRCFNIPLRA
jgi:3',5'-cyclic-AMP phosphodiesterase